ncbi:MAG TPA: AAA family ATPase [Ruania sp.]|nr:AAA family ATPase [Ruania sp.]
MDSSPAVATITAAARAAGPRCGATTVIAVDGPAGSGKTTLAAQLAPPLQAQVVHMDDLYEGWDGLAASGELLREQILLPLQQGYPGCYRRYDWYQERRAESHQVHPGGVVLIEGVGSVREHTREFYAAIVWVQAPDRLRLQRSIARDGPEAEAPLRRWMSQEREIFEATGTAALADVHLDAWGEISD